MSLDAYTARLRSWFTGLSPRERTLVFAAGGLAAAALLYLILVLPLQTMTGRREARVERHLKAVGLPANIADIPGKAPSTGQLLRLMAQDKKVKGGKLALVLVRGIGQAFVERDVALDRLTAFLEQECARQ